ncbi:MAG: putative serine proteinase, subtilase family [Planctomycetaceae bacterium]|nr:putative serine proteinase, subtilase family [Planctomycetaceae bacterium]
MSRFAVRYFLIVTCVAWGAPDRAYSQAFVEHLSPPILQRGAATKLQLLGTETAGAVGLWSSLPPEMLRVRSIGAGDATKAEVEVELAANAPLGIYGLRLATRSGLSNVHLFAVDELPIAVRPADLPADAAPPVTLPACITAPCRPATVDRYAITVQAGQRVTFEVIGNRFGKDYDPLVQIRNAAGKLVAECDNSVGLYADCRFAHTFAAAGVYSVEVRDARFEGNPTWHYVLRMGDFPEARMSIPSAIQPGVAAILTFPQVAGLQLPVTLPADRPLGTVFHEIRNSPAGQATWIPLTITDLPPQLEVEPNDKIETATPVKVPATLNGVLGQPGDSDYFAFELTQGQKLQFQGISRVLGGAADLELVMFDADGREVRRVDDVELEEGNFAFNAGKAGLHRLQVRDIARDGGPEFAYRIEVRAGGPQIQLLAETPDLTIPQGTFQPLALKVTRTEFAGDIRLELRGAPAGMTLEPAVIPGTATEFVANLTTTAATPEGIANLQIVGTATIEGAPPLQTIVRTKPMVDRQLRNVDLILYALREDQILLPPSLTSQLAVMVTPPSPFQIELPTQLVELTRFQTVDFPIVTTRTAGFAAPITFKVKGGQIGVEKEERNQIYAKFTPATPEQLKASGTFFNRILTNLAKHRVDLTASAEVNGQRINLTRTFTLDVRSAFQPTYELAQPMIPPGGTVKVKILANRVPTFDGPITMTMGPYSGFKFPETVEIPKGQPFVEVDFKAEPQTNPGRHDIRMQVAGFVNKYEESLNLPNLQIEIKKPDAK